MHALSLAYPQKERAIILLDKFNQSLTDSLNHLCDVSEGIVDINLLDNAKNKIQTLSTKKKLNSYIYFYNSLLIDSIKNNDVRNVTKLFNYFNQVELSPNEFITTYHDIPNYLKEEISKIITHDLESSLDINIIEYKKLTQCKVVIKNTFDIIKLFLPDLFEEIDIILNQILIFQSSNMTSGSSFNLQGLIYINVSCVNKSTIEILDIIIHECAHIYLYLICCYDQLILNPLSEKYSAPFREDLRPLIGIFHATFVLCRLIFSFNKLLSVEQFRTSEVVNLLEKYRFKYKLCKNILANNAKFTTLGQKLFADMNKLAKMN